MNLTPKVSSYIQIHTYFESNIFCLRLMKICEILQKISELQTPQERAAGSGIDFELNLYFLCYFAFPLLVYVYVQPEQDLERDFYSINNCKMRLQCCTIDFSDKTSVTCQGCLVLLRYFAYDYRLKFLSFSLFTVVMKQLFSRLLFLRTTINKELV